MRRIISSRTLGNGDWDLTRASIQRIQDAIGKGIDLPANFWQLLGQEANSPPWSAQTLRTASEHVDQLTEHERAILARRENGESAKQIAAAMKMKRTAVARALARIHVKLLAATDPDVIVATTKGGNV
jgi:DNA-binding NarL/FixJ family response regulator